MVRAEGLAKSFERPLFADVDLQIVRGKRWGLIGPNGCGKSTFLRCLLGEQPPDAGTVQIGAGMSIGYFDQHLTGVSDDDDVVDSIRPKHKQFLTQQAPRPAGPLWHIGRHATAKGGQAQRRRAEPRRAARLAAADANFLVLDEPTNHLNLWARDALERALAGFDGTVLFVSHDRYFVNRVADHLIIFEPGRVRVIEGNYEAYQLFLKSKAEGEAAPSPPGRAKAAVAGGQRPRQEHMPSNTPGTGRVATGTCRGIRTATRAPFSLSQGVRHRGRHLPRESRIEQLTEEMGDQATFRDSGQRSQSSRNWSNSNPP